MKGPTMRRSAKGSTRPTSKAPMLRWRSSITSSIMSRELRLPRVSSTAMPYLAARIRSLSEFKVVHPAQATRLLTGNLRCPGEVCVGSAVRQIPRIGGRTVVPHSGDEEIPRRRSQSRNTRVRAALTTTEGSQMISRFTVVVLATLCPIVLGGARAADKSGSFPASVDAARLNKAEGDTANWLSYGRTYSEQRFSPLARIDAGNAKELGLAWYADLDTNRGQQATPLVIDGVMYVSTAWSMVKAYDAASGKLLWSYDPEVPRELGVKGCCDVVNRGVAAWKGRIYVGTFDGRLV